MVRIAEVFRIKLSAMSEPKARGPRRRPERPPYCPDRVRTMIWYDAVWLARHHARTALGKSWQSRREVRDLTKHFGKWAPYRRGKNVPNDPSTQTNPIEVAEAGVPGTARWFRSPIWKAIHGNLTNWREIDDYLFDIEFAQEALFRSDEQLDGLPIRKLATDGVLRCGELTGLDLIETIVFLLERGRVTQWPKLTKAAIRLYDASTESIATIPQIERNYGAFFDAIERRYISVITEDASNFLPPRHARLRNRPGFDVTQHLLGPTSDEVRIPEGPPATA